MDGVWSCSAHGYFALVCVGMHEALGFACTAQVRAGNITYENHES